MLTETEWMLNPARPDALTSIDEGLPFNRRLAIWGEEKLRVHRASLVWGFLATSIAMAAHVIGMRTYPLWIDDPGVYLLQAWSVEYRDALTPTVYIYDHAPGGWIQIALYAKLTHGFDRYSSAMNFGYECMALAKLASCILMFILARRLKIPSPFAALAVVIFGLSPLSLQYTRLFYLDIW